AQEFSRIETLDGRFALGNAQAQNHAYEKAIKAYDEVLKAQPDHFAAKTNRAIAQAALNAQEEKRRKQEQEDSTPPDEKADETRVDPNQKGGKRIQITPEDVTTAGAAEAWMRQVQTSPADFLKLKFAIQAAMVPAREGAPKGSIGRSSSRYCSPHRHMRAPIRATRSSRLCGRRSMLRVSWLGRGQHCRSRYWRPTT